ncbi:MAG: hypothetical protein ABI839_06765 [Verrucomicrobiota bacterium]
MRLSSSILPHSRLLAAAAVLATIAAPALAWVWHAPRPSEPVAAATSSERQRESHTPRRSIAVLPFAEASAAGSDGAYLGDGLQQELLTRLKMIPEFKVISRSSTQDYARRPDSPDAIARELGVDTILTGRLEKREGHTIHLEVELISANDSATLWTHTYNARESGLTNVPTSLATAIVKQLRVRQSGRLRDTWRNVPTRLPVAYDTYLKGLSFDGKSGDPIFTAQKALSYYKRAVQLDPDFGVAWARLSRIESFLHAKGLMGAAEVARRGLQTAERLQPAEPETLLAKGYFFYWVTRDNEAAGTTFDFARTMLPGSSEIPAVKARLSRSKGEWGNSLGNWKEALVLDPRNSELLLDCGATYTALRQFKTARTYYDRALAITPDDLIAKAAIAATYQAEGNLQAAGPLLQAVDAATAPEEAFATKVEQLLLERNYAEAMHLLAVRSDYPEVYEGRREANAAWFAFIQHFSGDLDGAKASALKAQHLFAALPEGEPGNPARAISLSRIFLALGDQNGAVKEARRAVALQPSSRDAVEGPAMEENLAAIEAATGEGEQHALETLQRLLRIPYGAASAPVTPALLQLDPVWDPLRRNSQFLTLCGKARLSPRANPNLSPQKSIVPGTFPGTTHSNLE